MPSSREVLHDAVFDVVANQLPDGTPPETRQTFERLQREGHSEAEARRLIGAVVASEIYSMMKHREVFNLPRFVAALEQLPSMPWETGPEVNSSLQ